MICVAAAVSGVFALVLLVPSAQRRLVRGLLAFVLIMLFMLCTAYFMSELSSGGSGWIIAIGALLIGPVLFLRYYYRGGDQGP